MLAFLAFAAAAAPAVQAAPAPPVVQARVQVRIMRPARVALGQRPSAADHPGATLRKSQVSGRDGRSQPALLLEFS